MRFLGKLSAVLLVGVAVVGWVCPSVAAPKVSVQRLKVGVHKMDANLYIPDGPGPYPSMLVLGTSSGVSAADESFARALATEGFIAIVPKYLEAYGISEAERRKSFTSEARSLVRDFVEIIGELNNLPTAKPGAVGAMGFSNGGFFALLLASTGKIKAGVSYYGALDGARAYPNLGIFAEYFNSASSPVLVLAGDHDDTIHMGPVVRLEEILKAAEAPYELKVYPNAGHNFDRINAKSGDHAAAQDAWPRSLTFLRAHLN